MRRGAAALAALALGAALGPAPARASEPAAPTRERADVARIVVATVARAAPRIGARPVMRVRTAAAWAGGPVRLLVLGSATDAKGGRWLRVLLPKRPNGTSGWIDADRAKVTATPWRLLVDVRARRLTLLRAGRPVLSARVVVGAPGTPTPRGRFAVSEVVRTARGAAIGPWALHLTAFSRVLHSYDGGPGRVALHGRSGPLLADPLGSAASHGCVRMDNRVISRLARLAGAGTPVEIR